MKKKKQIQVSDEVRRIRESGEEALKWIRGEKAKVRVTTLFVPLSGRDVKEARKVLSVSQTQFARMIRVSPETVRKWEQNKNPIEGPAGILIKGLIQQPDLFGSILRPA